MKSSVFQNLMKRFLLLLNSLNTAFSMRFIRLPSIMILPIKILAEFIKSPKLVVVLHNRSISADIGKLTHFWPMFPFYTP